MVNTFTASPLFGRLFCDPETSSHFAAPRMLGRMLQVEQAYSEALGQVGLASADAVLEAVAKIKAFPIDGPGLCKGSDRDGLPVPALVAALRDGLSEEAQKAVHSGMTSQDVIDTSVHMTVRDLLTLFESRILDILAQLTAIEAKFGAQPLMGRTRMQAAMPIAVSDRLRTWREPLEARLSDLNDLRIALTLQFGGAVGRRDLSDGKGDQVAEVLAQKLDIPAGNGVWHTDRSQAVGVGHWLTLTAGALGKIGQDIALMAQQGVDEAKISGAGGSSAMPHKQNPVAAELMVAIGRYVSGQQGILAQALIHEQERSGAAWALEWLTLPAMVEATGASLRHAETVLGAVSHMGNPG